MCLPLFCVHCRITQNVLDRFHETLQTDRSMGMGRTGTCTGKIFDRYGHGDVTAELRDLTQYNE